MFNGASNFAQGVDQNFLLIIGISVLFLFGLTATMIYFVIRYNKKRNPVATQISGSITLEIIWTVIPLILVLLIFYYGYSVFKPMRIAPKNAIHIKAIAKMWDWTFEYDGEKQSKDLVVPYNKAVVLDLVSLDVIHSLFIPAFRIKEDMVPGTENFMWFIPTQKGTYEIFCAEYCGLRHSYMEAKVIVIDESEYQKWLTALPVKKKMDEYPGYKILQNNACLGCHTLDGNKIVGPSFKKLYGKKQMVIRDGKSRRIVSDEEYIKRSILEPNADVVEGYKEGLMKSYRGVLSDSDIKNIIEFMKVPAE